MNKEAVVHIYNGILLSQKKSISSKEVDEPRAIIQGEVSQKEKDKYHILMYRYGILKSGTEEFIYRAAMEKQT